MMRYLLWLTVLVIVLTGCGQHGNETQAKIATRANKITDPMPLPGVTVPYDSITVDAQKGDTLFYKTGSIILFPANAFLNKSGKIVEGKVVVKYREFTSPIDFYLANIPMTYDSAGKAFQFESSGMFEILAYEGATPVYVNPKSKPEVFLAASGQTINSNLYFLDSASKKWIYRQPATVLDLSHTGNKKNAEMVTSSEQDTSLVEPIKPERANDQDVILKMTIDPSSIKELLVYNNLKFGLDSATKNFNPKDMDNEWSSVTLEKGNRKGIFKLSLASTNKRVAYWVKPVFEADDYVKALKVFEKSNAEYQAKLKTRIAKDELKRHKYVQDSIQNVLIEAKNNEIKRINSIVEVRNKKIKEIAGQNKATYLYNAFSIDGFGVWNCDRITTPDYISLAAIFKSKDGETISLSNTAVICKSVNTVLQFTGNNVKLVKGAENVIIGIYNGRFAYTEIINTNKQDSTLNINKAQIFSITIVEEENNNYQYIKSVLF